MKRNLLIIALVLILAIAIAGFFLWQKKNKTIYNQAEGGQPTLVLEPASSTENLGSIFPININLNTDGEAIKGVEVVLHFDPLVFDVQDGDPNTDGVQINSGAITNFEILNANTVDNGTGIITYKVATASNFYTGNGILATVNLKAKSVSDGSNITFDFNPGEGSLTKVLNSSDTNILSQVSNGTYKIIEQLINAPSVSLSIDGGSSATKNQGQSATLKWQSSNASTCTASRGWSGTRAVSGQETVTVTAPTTYVLTCVGEGGSARASVSVSVSFAGGDTGGSTQEETPIEVSSPTSTPAPSKKTSTKPSKLTPLKTDRFLSLPMNLLPHNIAGQTAVSITNNSMKNWVLWILYAIIPLVLAGIIVLVSLRFRRKTPPVEEKQPPNQFGKENKSNTPVIIKSSDKNKVTDGKTHPLKFMR